MTTVAEIQQAIMSLPEAEYAELCRWLLDQDWERWEREFDEDVRAGRLDALADEALEAKRNGTLGYLSCVESPPNCSEEGES